MDKKKIAWSYTSLTQFVNCPKQYYEVKVVKPSKYPFVETPETKWGNAVHKALEHRLINKTSLPGNMAQYEPLMQTLDSLPGAVYGERKYTIKQAGYQPTTWFDKDAWCRGIIDAMWLDGSTAYAVDYKTGKFKPDSDQLALFAGLVFQHHPEIETVHTKFLWLQELGTDKKSTGESFQRKRIGEIWNRFTPTIGRLQEAYEHDVWPAKKSGLCGWCPVTDCENWFQRRT